MEPGSGDEAKLAMQIEGIRPQPLAPPRSAPKPESWNSTDFAILQFSHEWVVRKLAIHYANHPACLQSPTFLSGRPGDRLNWRMTFYLKETTQQQTKHSVRVGLSLVQGADRPLLATVQLGLSGDSRKCTYESECQQMGNGTEIKTSLLAETNCVLNESNGFLCNGSLTVFCDIAVYRVNEVVHVSGSRVTPYLKSAEPSCHTDLVIQDFGSLLQQGLCSDVIIVAAGKEFRAHKGILSARSHVFKVMFEHKMEESTKNKVTIEGLQSEVVQEMLTYIYTGKAPNMDKMTESLFSAADRYALDQLKLLCERELAKQLSVQNAAETLILADQHSAATLKSVCMDYIAAHVPEVVASHDWPNLEHHHELMTEIVQKLGGQPLTSLHNYSS